MMPITVLPDRVTFATDFIPRRLDLPKVLSIPAGQTVTLADGAVWDYVEVFGRLTISRTQNTTAKITTLIVMPGGVLDLGTVDSPIPSSVKVNLIGRDVPIDVTRDPFQWGNGLVNFGQRWTCGALKTPFVTLAVDAQKGATQLTLMETPTGWRVGDELIIPDTRSQQFSAPTTPFPLVTRREAPVTIAAISGSLLTLSKPLDFEHLTVLGLDGRLGVKPIVANVTRNIVIRSENTTGTRWHTADVGDDACWNNQGYAAVGMGRTTTGVIDDTKPDLSHIGTNPKGRYAEHHHHACHMMPPLECGSKGNVYRGIGAGKWGHVTHGVHDTFITDNIALDFPGAGFITEDGYEVRNEFRENLACYNLNQDPNLQSARGNLLNNQPGVEGTGIWAHGIHNVFVGNQAWNNTVGINLFNRDGKTGLYPSVPGGTPDTLYQAPDLTNNPPLVFTENTVVANNTGQEHWDLAQAPLMETLRAINNFTGAFVSAGASVQSANYKNPVFIQTYDPAVAQGWNGQCILMTTGYSDPFIITGGYLSGAAVAITGVPNTSYTATDCTFQCKIGIYIDVKLADAEAFGVKFYFSGYTFLPLGSLPHQYVVDVTGVLWDGTGPFPLDGDGPPPPPPPSWVTLPGIFQQQQQPDPTKFRFCDVNGMNCVDFVKA